MVQKYSNVPGLVNLWVHDLPIPIWLLSKIPSGRPTLFPISPALPADTPLVTVWTSLSWFIHVTLWLTWMVTTAGWYQFGAAVLKLGSYAPNGIVTTSSESGGASDTAVWELYCWPMVMLTISFGPLHSVMLVSGAPDPCNCTWKFTGLTFCSESVTWMSLPFTAIEDSLESSSTPLPTICWARMP